MEVKIRTRELKDGNKTIYLDFYDKGKRWYEYLRLYLVPEANEDAIKANKNAMERAISIKAQRILGIEKEKVVKGNNDSLLFIEWAKAYLDKFLADKTRSATYKQQMKMLVTTLEEFLKKGKRMNIRMSQVNASLYKGYLSFLSNSYKSSKWKKEERSLSASTFFTYQTRFNTMLNQAVKEGALKENPYYRLSEKEVFSKVVTEKPYLTKDELMALAAVPTNATIAKQNFMFCCFTGLRHSDLKALKWGNIVETDSGLMIKLNAMKKTKRSVTIPLGKSALKWLPDRNGASDDEPIFKVLNVGGCNRDLQLMARKAGISKHISFNTSRHTFATLTLSASSDLYTVSKLLGHTAVKTTQIYADVMLNRKKEAVSLMDGIIN